MKGWWSGFSIISVLEIMVFTTKVVSECPGICNCENTVVSCQNNGLTDLPDGIDPQVTSLDLSINNFGTIPNQLRTFENLKSVNMSQNKIATLGHLDFKGLINLEMLDLSSNLFHDWKDIHSQAFINLSSLTFLEFSNNAIRSLPQFSIYFSIKSLRILKLNNCSMTALPSGFLNGMVGIQEVHLAANPISVINIPLSSKTLKFIDLSRTSLTKIATNALKGLEVLETLYLKKIKTLRNVTINSDSLRYLDLSESSLEFIPYGKMGVSNLNIYGNLLRELNNNKFINIPNLITLNLSLNAITSIKERAFNGLENLEILDLSLNKIGTIEENTFKYTNSLDFLDISHNYLTSIDSISSASLTVLDASYCEIKYLSKNSLSRLQSLASLSLRRNFITYVPDNWEACCLTSLDLSDCRIKNINNKSFTEMTYLRELDLSNNRLTTIQFSFFPQHLSKLKLADNQWRCECAILKETFDWLQMRNSYANDLICDSPDSVYGQTWLSACEDQWYPAQTKKDNLWWYSIALLISMVFLLVTVMTLRKMNEVREKRFREIEEQRRQQERETRETLQRMQQIQREYREEASRNAPDPRESQGPPSYIDALLLPKLDSSHPSLAGSLHSFGSRGSLRGSNPEVNKKGKVRRKRRRRRSESTDRISQPQTNIDGNESEPERSQRPLESDF